MSEEPVVSVIVPTRNRPVELAAALRSIAGQNASVPVEVVVVNDGGRDVRPVLERFGSSIQLIDLSGNVGIAIARNLGIEAARGEFITFLDDDDVFLGHHLRVTLDALRRTGADLVYPTCLVSGSRVDPGGSAAARGDAAFDFGFDRDFLGVANYIPITGVAGRADRLRVARFERTFRLREDWDLWLQLAWTHRLEFAHVAEPTVVYHRIPAHASATAGTHQDLVLQRRFSENYELFVSRWPVPSRSRVARYRRHMRTVHRMTLERLSSGGSLHRFHYPRVLRALYEAFQDRLPETGIPAALAAAITPRSAS
jgi:hypothetical protein